MPRQTPGQSAPRPSTQKVLLAAGLILRITPSASVTITTSGMEAKTLSSHRRAVSAFCCAVTASVTSTLATRIPTGFPAGVADQIAVQIVDAEALSAGIDRAPRNSWLDARLHGRHKSRATLFLLLGGHQLPGHLADQLARVAGMQRARDAVGAGDCSMTHRSRRRRRAIPRLRPRGQAHVRPAWK